LSLISTGTQASIQSRPSQIAFFPTQYEATFAVKQGDPRFQVEGEQNHCGNIQVSLRASLPLPKNVRQRTASCKTPRNNVNSRRRVSNPSGANSNRQVPAGTATTELLRNDLANSLHHRAAILGGSRERRSMQRKYSFKL
jgi:hypothetical protein